MVDSWPTVSELFVELCLSVLKQAAVMIITVDKQVSIILSRDSS